MSSFHKLTHWILILWGRYYNCPLHFTEGETKARRGIGPSHTAKQWSRWDLNPGTLAQGNLSRQTHPAACPHAPAHATFWSDKFLTSSVLLATWFFSQMSCRGLHKQTLAWDSAPCKDKTKRTPPQTLGVQILAVAISPERSMGHARSGPNQCRCCQNQCPGPHWPEGQNLPFLST